jgi:hypothetical protein
MKFSEIINDQQLATEAIHRWITTAVCMVVAVVAANWIVDQRFFMFAVLAGVVATTFVTVGMQQKAWILVVICWGFRGQINALVVPVTTRDLVVMVVACSYVAQRALGRTVQRTRGVLGALVTINCAYIAFTFLLHPVGLRAFGAGTMGGRPYFNVFVVWCAYWIIVHMPESYKSVTKIPLWLMAGATFTAMIAVSVYIFPSITPYVWFFYGDIDIGGYLGSLKVTEEAAAVHRFISFGPFGVMLVQCLSAYFPPRTLANPLRWQSYLCLLGFAAVLASGYRNELLLALAYLVLAAWFHGGWRDVVIGGVIGTLFLGFVVFGQGRLFELPLTAQRALGSLPGQWDEAVKQEVKISNMRWDWWRQLIEEGSVVDNWWFGDGFGVSEADWTAISGQRLTFNEAATVTGGFHNGPLTAIRYAGVVGLVLLYALTITAAVYSVKCVRRCRDTPLLPVSIFLAVQLVWAPIHYTFFFGSYANEMVDQIFLVGLLSLVWRMSVHTPPSPAPVLTTKSLSRNNGRTLLST